MCGYFLGFEFLDYVELMSACPPNSNAVLSFGCTLALHALLGSL
jgi:hypothetical protein